jgi:hypothetical protein
LRGGDREAKAREKRTRKKKTTTRSKRASPATPVLSFADGGLHRPLIADRASGALGARRRAGLETAPAESGRETVNDGAGADRDGDDAAE